MAMSHKYFSKKISTQFILTAITVAIIFLSGCMTQPIKSTDPDIQHLENKIANNSDDFQSIGRLADLHYEKYSSTNIRHHRERAMSLYKDFLNHQPNHSGAVNALYLLNIDVAMNENFPRVRNDIHEIYTNNPSLKDTQLPPPDFIEALYLLARSKNNTDVNNAIKFIQKSIQSNPNHAGSHALLGSVYFDQERDDLAIASFKQSLLINPENYEVQKKLGESYTYKSHERICENNNPYIDKAIETLKTTIGKTEDDYDARDLLSGLYEVKGLPQLAIFERKESLSLKYTSADQIHLAGLYSMNTQLEKAKSIATEVTIKDPSYDWSWRNLGLFYFYEGSWQQSINTLNQFKNITKDTKVYAVIMQSLASRHLNMQDKAKSYLSEINESNIESEWEANLLRYFKKKINASQLKSRAINKCEDAEANYYIGYDLLLNGEHRKANELLNKVVDSKVYYIYEYYAAKYALKLSANNTEN